MFLDSLRAIVERQLIVKLFIAENLGHLADLRPGSIFFL